MSAPSPPRRPTGGRRAQPDTREDGCLIESQSGDQRLGRRESRFPCTRGWQTKQLYRTGALLPATAVCLGEASGNCLTPGLTVWTPVGEQGAPSYRAGHRGVYCASITGWSCWVQGWRWEQARREQCGGAGEAQKSTKRHTQDSAVPGSAATGPAGDEPRRSGGGQEADASDNGSVSWARKKNAFQVLGTRLASGRLMLSHVISFLHQVIASVLHMSDVSREGTCVNRSRRSMRTEAHLGSAHSTHPPRACCM